MMHSISNILPVHVNDFIESLDRAELNALEEIRLRCNQPVECLSAKKAIYSPFRITQLDTEFFLNQLSEYSLYAFEEELQKGYITIEGGHRVGLAGKTILENGYVKTIRPIRSFNIRIARQKIGVAETLVKDLYDVQTGWKNTLLIGPPQTGKTTVLRDLARMISQGTKTTPSEKVAIVDERSEIAGCMNGIPQHELGSRVDVLDGCPKAEGMMMMIRSMSPHVTIVDEIGRQEDAKAILEARHAGVIVIATAHGRTFEDVYQRPVFKALFESQAFERVVELKRTPYPGSVNRIRLPSKVVSL